MTISESGMQSLYDQGVSIMGNAQNILGNEEPQRWALHRAIAKLYKSKMYLNVALNWIDTK